ncbi:MAG: thioredoxin-dependent thiol peroxidase [Nitrospirae bacterium]|nr:MAG: thioredoxin-dependent thiol peroxidase [Nitrospirota bacterium]
MPKGSSRSPHGRQLKVGQRAPAFALPGTHGQTVRLSQLKGKNVVLYFYPKDDTPGCTKEACVFRDAFQHIQAANAVLLGVSADSVESHEKFSKKYNLPFPLLSDTDKRVVQAYGVWKERSLYGRKFMGIERTTFIIDTKGHIAKIFPKVKVESHVGEVLQALQGLA